MGRLSLDHGRAATAAGARLEQVRQAFSGIAPSERASGLAAVAQGVLRQIMGGGEVRVLSPEVVKQKLAQGFKSPSRRETQAENPEHILTGHRLLGHAIEASYGGSLQRAFATWVTNDLKAKGIRGGPRLTEQFYKALQDPVSSIRFGIALADTALGLDDRSMQDMRSDFRFTYAYDETIMPGTARTLVLAIADASGAEPDHSDDLRVALGMTTLGRLEYRRGKQFDMGIKKKPMAEEAQRAAFARIPAEIDELLMHNAEGVPSSELTDGPEDATPPSRYFG